MKEQEREHLANDLYDYMRSRGFGWQRAEEAKEFILEWPSKKQTKRMNEK